MLDVLHVMFEDDMVPRWEQDADTKSRIRTALYDSMYNKKYKYAIDSQARTNDWEFDTDDEYGEDPIYAPSPDGTVKPYFPPTDPDELSSILDGPVG